MAAAAAANNYGSTTGDSDGPSKRELALAAYCLSKGLEKAEIFAVRPVEKKEKPPCGMISLFRPNGACCIFEREKPTRHYRNNQDSIVIGAPRTALEAYFSFSLFLDLHDGSEPSCKDISTTPKFDWPSSDCDTVYDLALNEIVDTPYSPVEVTYAILRNGVEAVVEIKFLSLDGEDPMEMCGKISAKSHLLSIGSTLFDNDDDDIITVSSGVPIPLAKRVVAVPLLWTLNINIDLRDSSGNEIVKCIMEFHPEADGAHIKGFTGKKGHIEVTIDWSL